MKYFLIIWLTVLSTAASSQTINYEEIFGKDYELALQFITNNDSIIRKGAMDFHVNEKILKAIIFPELIRYNRVYDAIEITSLKFLYIKKGSYYSDFSVGYFQMKPSFAEKIEVDANTLLDKNFLQKINFHNYSNKTESDRELRLNRITNLEGQLKYLIAFYRLCEIKFEDQIFKTETEKLKFYATAYNSGYYKSHSDLQKHLLSNSFYTGKINKSKKYNYANICAYYYENN